MMTLVSNDLPLFMEFFNPAVTAYTSALRGPEIEPSDLTNHGQLWNLADWEMN